MNDTCKSDSDTPLTEDQSTQFVIHFPSDSFWMIQVGVALLSSVYAFKKYVEEHLGISILIILIGALIILIRAKFKTRPPEWATIDSINNIMRLKQRWPLRTITKIDISKLKLVKVYVQRYRRFPRTVVELYIEGMEKQSIYFDVESSEKRFFATPNEVIPVSVGELVSVLSKISIENKGE